jgi:hypothetical protein
LLIFVGKEGEKSKVIKKKIYVTKGVGQGNLYTVEGDLTLVQSSVHLKSGCLCRENILFYF